MRACLGFLFGRVELQKEDVPRWLAEKLVRGHQQLKDKMASKELYHALDTFEARLSAMLEVPKDRTLLREVTHLRKVLADEQRQRRKERSERHARVYNERTRAATPRALLPH